MLRTVAVAASVGLHARPAALFCEAVAASGAAVTITNEAGRTVDAASILGVLTLGVAHGQRVVLECDDESVLDRLAELLQTDLDSA